MRTPRLVVPIIMLAAIVASSACSSGGGAGRPNPGASPNASVATAADTVASCMAAVRGVDLSSWRAVAAKGFTLCLPPGWQGRFGTAHHGRSTINWGTGAPPVKRVAVTSRVVVRAGQRPPPPEPPPGTETRQFDEEIGSRNATLYRNRFDGTYYVGARWDAAGVWLTGETSDSSAADLILTIARTVRFTSK